MWKTMIDQIVVLIGSERLQNTGLVWCDHYALVSTLKPCGPGKDAGTKATGMWSWCQIPLRTFSFLMDPEKNTYIVFHVVTLSVKFLACSLKEYFF